MSYVDCEVPDPAAYGFGDAAMSTPPVFAAGFCGLVELGGDACGTVAPAGAFALPRLDKNFCARPVTTQ